MAARGTAQVECNHASIDVHEGNVVGIGVVPTPPAQKLVQCLGERPAVLVGDDVQRGPGSATHQGGLSSLS